MSKLAWSKWFWSAHSDKWGAHPLHIDGAWHRILESLHKSDTTGTLTQPLEVWAAVLRQTPEVTITILEYMIKYKLANIEIGTDITITSRRVAVAAKEAEAAAKRKTTYKKSSRTVDRREEIKASVLEVYPEARGRCQPAGFAKELNAIMIEASKGLGDGPSSLAERALGSKIIDRIKLMKGTAQWTDNNGGFIPGIGNFMKTRCWESAMNLPMRSQKLRVVGEEAVRPRTDLERRIAEATAEHEAKMAKKRKGIC